jgi:hypothetical protein
MADAKISALPAAGALTGAELVPVVQSGVTRRTTIGDIRTIDVVKVCAGTQANSTVTAAAITELSASIAPGTYLLKVWFCYRSAATTTGVEFYLRTTGGTVTRCVSTWYTLTTGGAAATGIADQATTLTAQMMEGKGQRAAGVASGPMQGVDTANADQFAVMEGIVIVTATTTLDVMFTSEVAASAVTVMEGTTLTLSKVA